MLGHLLRRAIVLLPTLLVILAAAFTFVRFAPGGPFDAAHSAPASIQRQLGAAYDAQAPLGDQTYHFTRGLGLGDLGRSMTNADKGVAEIVAEGAATTATLTLSALALALIFGGGLGIVAALRAGEIFDRLVGAAAFAFMCLLPLLLAPLLQRVFATEWRLLPEAGLDRDSFSFQTLLLPILALGLPFAGLAARQTRAGMAEATNSEACRIARAKGMPEARVLWRHVAPAAALSVVRQSGGLLSGLCMGSLVVETLFQLPGIGRALVIAARQHDAPVVAGVVLVYAAAVVVLVWSADLIARALDPRMRAA